MIAGLRAGRFSMAPIIPDPRRIKSFRTGAAFEAWLATNHPRETEVWLEIHKKDSGVPAVRHAEALDIALCWACCARGRR
jgi:uncharacterized protein YdeI (YjbR/CyaY-like superfamily)